jgi:HAE1 family hydrophobic/amphiphilic exporter-1
MQGTGMREMPKLDMREVRVDVALDQNFDLASATKLFRQVEETINGLREPLGVKKVLSMNSPTDGFFDVYLFTEDDDPKWFTPPYTTEQVMQILSEKIPTRTPGAEFRLSMGDIGDNDNRSDITLFVRGDERGTLEDYAERLKKILQDTNPFVADVVADVEKSKQEMQIKIDQPLAQQAGVSPLILAQTVDAALRGARMPYMKQGRREIPVWAQFREEDRKSQANLDNVMVPGLTGKLVPLQDLTDYSKVRSATAIKRVNGKNVIMLSAKLNTKNLSLFKEEAKRSVALLDLPPGYNVDFGDELEDLESNIFNFTSSLMMAIILVYIVMAALFESLLLPMSIMTSVPLALGGAVWMIYFMDNQFDQITLIGCIIMVGVIVKNGIVVVDYTSQLYSKSGDRTDAVLRAGRDRFRPVIMTALTTILGLVPLALAKTGGASTFSGLGQAWIGGLTVGTVLTLFVVPVFFTIFDDIHLWARSFFGNLLGRRVESQEAPVAVLDDI